MDLEIRPDPTPEERAAILAALAAVGDVEEARPGPWWEAGLREAVGEEGRED